MEVELLDNLEKVRLRKNLLNVYGVTFGVQRIFLDIMFMW